MALSASLIASIVSAVIEAAAQSYASPEQYETYIINRTLPPEAKVGVMQPPAGDGVVVINDKPLPLAPAVQFRSPQNLIVMPMTIQEKKDVIYLTDASGAIFRIWMVSRAEISAHSKKN